MDILLVLKVLVGLLAWHTLGFIILVAIDEDGELYKWIQSCPREVSWFAKPLVYMCWPVVVYMYRRGE